MNDKTLAEQTAENCAVCESFIAQRDEWRQRYEEARFNLNQVREDNAILRARLRLADAKLAKFAKEIA